MVTYKDIVQAERDYCKQHKIRYRKLSDQEVIKRMIRANKPTQPLPVPFPGMVGMWLRSRSLKKPPNLGGFLDEV